MDGEEDANDGQAIAVATVVEESGAAIAVGFNSARIGGAGQELIAGHGLPATTEVNCGKEQFLWLVLFVPPALPNALDGEEAWEVEEEDCAVVVSKCSALELMMGRSGE